MVHTVPMRNEMGTEGTEGRDGPIPVRPVSKRVRAKGTKPELEVRMDTPRTTSVAGGGNLSAHEAEMAEKARKAMEMRAAGATYTQIAKRLGYAGPGPVYGLIKRHIQKMSYEGVTEMRAVQLDRLHTMLMAVWPKVVDPNHPQTLQAMDRALSITDRITRMYGLDSPPEEAGEETAGMTVSNTITVGGSTAEVLAALRAMADARKAVEGGPVPEGEDAPDVPEAEVVEDTPDHE